ncbi:PilZ domain-containing protein [Novosphingobium flavum]|uniref:PilZ domain-containing protein n=1 Tax=Novosphingobium aerophilum TaxID=2839843 RepID=A0A7X1KCR0_9SPHN|nr:PilZ domain-containing protein [Novosphingobium aerophilum]MBC2652550.1 PilZ domain-containing protein [Novosphingobium aerophilum]MBC2662578.1 PilZ domain-containing protein [Novosphingobium aerophilum]
MNANSHLGPDHQAAIGRRREARLRVRLEAQLITLDGTVRMVMADLSRNGARVSGHLPRLRLKQQAIIQWTQFEAFGIVAWIDGNQCGLEFDEPLPHQVLVKTREIHDTAPLQSDRELARGAARAFVQGKVRL